MKVACASSRSVQVFQLCYSMNMEKVDIFIDAGNFYHMVLKKLGCREMHFDFEKFAEFLKGDNREIAFRGKRYYVGTVREMMNGRESKQAMSNQNALFSDLMKTNWQIKTSKLRTRLEKIKVDDRMQDYQKILKVGIKEIVYERSRKKGIDVKLATDLIVGAVDNKYDTAIVVSSDTDLIPAVQWVRDRMKKKVEYIGFSLAQTSKFEATRPVKTLIYNTDVQRVLSENDIKPFMKP